MKIIGLSVAFLLSASASALTEEFPPQLDLPSAQDLWVSFDPADFAAPQAAKLPLSSPVMSNTSALVYKIRPDMLPILSEFMHQNFKRCGGYFAHDTMAAAEESMRPPVAKQAMEYTLDQQATVQPLVAKVNEETIRGTITTMAAYTTRYYQSPIGVDAALWLKGRWSEFAAKIPRASVELITHAWKQPSVILTIPGAGKPEEIVILGGHLDSIAGWGNAAARAPGADDNASGIAVLTEAARILSESGYQPERTIQFMGYAAEEVGLRGSQDIAAKYAAGGKKVVGVIQFDMSNFPGSGAGIFLLTDNVDPALSKFTAQLVTAYTGVAANTTKCGYACSDHASWTKKGFPSAMAFEATMDGMNRALHTDRDTLETAGGNASHSVPFAKLAVAFAVELAKTAPGMR